MKSNKNLLKIKFLAAIIFGLVCFGAQVSALSTQASPHSFAIIAPAPGTATGSAGTATTPTPTTSGATSSDTCQLTPSSCIVTEYINPLIKFLSAVVGIAVVISVVIGGIQYSSARDNPQAVGAAKKRITNAIFALVVYMFLFALLNFIIPGGLL